MFGRIALDLNRDTNQKRRLESAIQLALRHQAELVGIYTNQLAPQYFYDEAIVPIQVLESMKSYVEKDRAQTKAFFLKETQAAGLDAQWRTPQGSPTEALALHARFCDLLIMSQTDDTEPLGACRTQLFESRQIGGVLRLARRRASHLLRTRRASRLKWPFRPVDRSAVSIPARFSDPLAPIRPFSWPSFA